MADSEALLVNSDAGYGKLLTTLADLYREHKFMLVVVKTGKQRTSKQQAAIEVYCRELAILLNDAGFDQRKVLAAMKEGVEIPNSQESVKELWREIQKAILDKESTKKLERPEVSRVYGVFNRWTASTFGISMNFPSED